MFGIRRIRIRGSSMEPALREGRVCYVRSYFPWERIRRGDVVLLGDPRTGRFIVKRVRRKEGRGYIVRGDNAQASTDSRAFGSVPRRAIMGKILNN